MVNQKTDETSRRRLQELFLIGKRLFFPGLDLHTRLRYKKLPPLFRKGDIWTLDAGCGNGCLGLVARRFGNKVLGVSYDPAQIRRNREFYQWMGYGDMEFEVCNLYDLPRLGRRFDQIICGETLEHIARDREVIQTFADILTEDGLLHLCSPYAFHPHHNLGRINDPETGGHVRDGYTLERYKALLEPAGLTVTVYLGLGSEVLVWTDLLIRSIRNRWGDGMAIPLFLLLGPLAFFIDRWVTPKVPYSLYVQAVKSLGS